MGASMNLPSDFAERSLKRFDELRTKGELFYDTSDVEYAEGDGFQFEFRITSALLKKPILAADDPGRKEAIGPFTQLEPQFVLTDIGSSHILQFSKYSLYRPHFILHSKSFVEQTADLDLADIEAVWAVMNSLGTPKIALYNCGVEAGSSQCHKHMQILPRPSPDEFGMFPDKVKLSQKEPICIPKIPFVHWVIEIPPNATAEVVAFQYQ